MSKGKGISKEDWGKISKGLGYASGVISGIARANEGHQDTPRAAGGTETNKPLKERNTYDVNSFDEEDTKNAAGR